MLKFSYNQNLSRGSRVEILLLRALFPRIPPTYCYSVGGMDIQRRGSKFLGATLIRNTAVEYRYGPLEASDDGVVFRCLDPASSANSATLRLVGETLQRFRAHIGLSSVSTYSVQFSSNTMHSSKRPK